MMRKISALLAFFVLLCLLSACSNAASNTYENISGSSAAQREPDAASSAALDETMAFVNEQRKSVNEPDTDTVQVYRLDTLEVFVSTEIGGAQLITVRETATGDVYNIEYPSMTAEWFEETDEARVLKFYTDGAIFYGDQVYKPNDAWVWMRYDTQEVVDMQYVQDWHQARVGVLHSAVGGVHEFSGCEIAEGKIIFGLDLPEVDYEGYDGTEIFLDYAQEDNSYVIGFRDTALSLAPAFIDGMRAMEGIEDVQATFLDSRMFTGTEVLITCAAGHGLEYYFNSDGSTDGFKDFYLVVVF